MSINNIKNFSIKSKSCNLIYKTGLKIIIVKKKKNINKVIIPNFIKLSTNLNILTLEIAKSIDDLKRKEFNSICYKLDSFFNEEINQVQYKKELLLKGLGFKATLEKDKILTLKLGYSHLIKIAVPENISVKIKNNNIHFISTDKQQLGNFVNYIKSLKFPDSYKGKGL